MTKFEVGKLYAQEYASGDGRYPRECVNRTEKTVSFRELHNEIKRYKIRYDRMNGSEYVSNNGWIDSKPTNQFNMCTL